MESKVFNASYAFLLQNFCKVSSFLSHYIILLNYDPSQQFVLGIGGQFVTEISGDFFTVMGLPMHKTSKLIAKALQAE